MTHHHLVLAAVTSIGLVAAGGNVQSAEKLSLRVTPNVSNAPCNLIVQAIIPRQAPYGRTPTRPAAGRLETAR